jgi:NAD(P)-dependent dehydrogenase (short-subunit alcohol dehydrogenase family)
MKLDGKVVVVTGSGNGIGAAFARRFTAEGAKVVVTDREADAAKAVADEIGSVALPGDITSEDTVKAVAELARKTYGQVDIWFSNAGYSGPREPGDIQTNEIWQMTWDLHVMSHVYAARAVLPEMVERGEGYLLQTASAVAFGLQLDKATYSVTKHASLTLCEWLAAHYRDKGVRVSCFCPGPMNTRMLRSNGFSSDHPVMKAALTPEQVADLLVRGIAAEKFLILQSGPSDAAPMLLPKTQGYEAWLNEMSGQVAVRASA